MKTNKVSVIEITDRNFTIVDLIRVNASVKEPTLRSFVKRNVESGRYAVTGTLKSGKRGKPSVTYTIVSSTKTNDVVS